MAAPSAPPADTPMIPGSAIGLRNSPCITAPETPSAAPTTSASRIRGNLIVVMIACSASDADVSAIPRCSSSMPIVREGGMVNGPTAAATITSTNPTTARYRRSHGELHQNGGVTNLRDGSQPSRAASYRPSAGPRFTSFRVQGRHSGTYGSQKKNPRRIIATGTAPERSWVLF